MSLNTPTGLSEDLKAMIQQLSDSQKDALLNLLQDDKYMRESKNKIKSDLIFNKDGLIEDINKNCIKKEPNREYVCENWAIYEWEVINIQIPTIWKCKWLKTSLFISNKNIAKKQLLENSDLIERSHSTNDLTTLHSIIKSYFLEYNIQLDDKEVVKIIYESILWREFLRAKDKKNNNRIRAYMPVYNLYKTTGPAKLLLKI